MVGDKRLSETAVDHVMVDGIVQYLQVTRMGDGIIMLPSRRVHDGGRERMLADGASPCAGRAAITQRRDTCKRDRMRVVSHCDW